MLKTNFETFNHLQLNLKSRKALIDEIKRVRAENHSLKTQIKDLVKKLKLEQKVCRIFSQKLALNKMNK